MGKLKIILTVLILVILGLNYFFEYIEMPFGIWGYLGIIVIWLILLFIFRRRRPSMKELRDAHPQARLGWKTRKLQKELQSVQAQMDRIVADNKAGRISSKAYSKTIKQLWRQRYELEKQLGVA